MSDNYYTIDVFTEQAFNGAQIAVFPNASNLSTQTMQTLAKELNLSETVFISPTEKQFELTVYTPYAEAGFGSHTTLAAATALVESQQVILDKQHTPIEFSYTNGTFAATVEKDKNDLLFTQMSLSTSPMVDNYVPSNEELADILSLNIEDLNAKPFHPKLVSNEGLFLVVPINSFGAIRRARFDISRWQASQAPSTMAQQILLVSESTEHMSADFHLRLMGTQISDKDDPPVGSSIPAFSAFLCAHQHLSLGTYSFTIERGTREQRQSILHVEMDHKGHSELTIRIGGNSVLMSKGQMRLS